MVRILGRGGEAPGRPTEEPLPDSPTSMASRSMQFPNPGSQRQQVAPYPSSQPYPQSFTSEASFQQHQQISRTHCPPYPADPYSPRSQAYSVAGDSQDRTRQFSNPFPESLMGRAMADAKVPWYRRIGLLTILVIIACITVLIVTMGVNNCPAQPHYAGMSCALPFLGRFSFEPLKINPMLGPSASTLLNMGALESVYIMTYKQYWRLLTAMWLHAGVIHLVCNMLGIYFLGVPMEREFGFIKFGIIYLLSGISGAILSTLLLENTVSVGASGALFGLAGATLTELCINWDLYANRISAFISLLILILINLAIGLLPYIDNFAHIGGLVGGLLLGLALLVKPQRGYVNLKDRDNVAHAAAIAEAGGVVASSRNTMCQNVTRIVAALTFLGLFFTGLALILTSTYANCPWCHYMDCVPTSLWDCPNPSNSSATGAGPICQQMLYNNGTGLLACANGQVQSFPNMTSYTDYQLRVLCTQTCS